MEDGKVLVWGTGKNGSLGLGADLLTIKLPTPIPSLGKYLSDAVSKCSYTTFYQCIPLLLCSLKSQLSNKPKQYKLTSLTISLFDYNQQQQQQQQQQHYYNTYRYFCWCFNRKNSLWW